MPVPQEREAVQRRLLRDTAYDTLCDAIVSGTLAPGEMLHDAELCSWLGLSRTPVRGALTRLEDEGLVETAPQRFTRVTPLEQDAAHDLFAVLAALHALAAELAVPRLEGDDAALLEQERDRHVAAVAARDAPACYATDDRFHDVMVARSGNADLVHLIRHLSPRLHRHEALHRGALPGRRALAQHEAIFARAAGGDARGTASASREHWLDVGGLFERALDPAPRVSGGGGAGASAALRTRDTDPRSGSG